MKYETTEQCRLNFVNSKTFNTDCIMDIESTLILMLFIRLGVFLGVNAVKIRDPY
jgi:hypothetical protein